jgi:glycosyltransferase involved in cell wall biosynthesis
MPASPFISIITIVYNDRSGFKKTIKSVIDQDYKNIEYIVIDGGSTDGTVQAIEKNEPHINYWVSEPDKGIADAFNKGIKKANGDWILFLNAGDSFFKNDILVQVVPFLERFQDSEVVFGKIKLVDQNGKAKGSYGKPFDLNSFQREMTIPHQAAFHNRNLFEKVGLYDLKYKYCMDYELLLRVNNPDFKYIDLFISDMLAGGISQQSPKAVYREFNEVKKKYLGISDVKLKIDYYENMLRYRLSKIKNWLIK